VFRQAEQARLRIAGLRARGDGADFDEAETQREQCIDVLAILVQAGGQADRIGEGQPEHGARHRRDACGQQRRGAGAVGQVQCGQAEAVGALGVEREQEGAGKRIHA